MILHIQLKLHQFVQDISCDSMFGACDGVQLGGELIDKFSTLVRDQYRRASVSVKCHE